ncbi:hypothetical protein NQZ68_005108 [Dissostichus eleginoides]|nr:hypothetical protein NQZ68_005108 [Dissostichus eleginoides]
MAPRDDIMTRDMPSRAGLTGSQLAGAQNVTNSAKRVLLAAKAIVSVALSCGAAQQLDAEGWDTPAPPPPPPLSRWDCCLNSQLLMQHILAGPISSADSLKSPCACWETSLLSEGLLLSSAQTDGWSTPPPFLHEEQSKTKCQPGDARQTQQPRSERRC